MIPNDPSVRMAAWLESAWLARYLERELSSDEAAWFEGYLLDKKDLLAMVEADTHLRDALAAEPATWRSSTGSVRQGEALPGLRAVAHPVGAEPAAILLSSRAAGTGGAPSTPSRSRPRQPLRALALAASLLLGVGLGWFATKSTAPDAPALIPSPTRLVFDTMRGAAAPPHEEHARSDSAYVLLEMAVPPGASAIELSLGNHAPVALVPSSEGFASVLVRRDLVADTGVAALRYILDGKPHSREIPLSR